MTAHDSRAIRKLALGALHFASAVAGLITFGIVGGLMGVADPFWRGDKGLLLFAAGLPVLFFGSIVYYWFLSWSSIKLSTTRMLQFATVGLSGFIGGVALVYIFGEVARAMHAIIPVSPLELSLLVTTAIFAALTAVLTRVGAAITNALSIT